MHTFEIGESFLLDSQPFRVLSGSMHYQRIHPDLWRDRIRKARAMGLNTIETYIPWNAHAPQRGTFDVRGGLDLGRFLDVIAEEDMFAIVRPGPYICAEWDSGGLPAWLFKDPAVGVRRNEPKFMAAVAEYYRQFGPIVSSRQVQNGGPVILVQVENEYGAYGSDPAYLRALEALTREVGITVPLTTVDQPQDDMLANGSLPSLLRTGSFGSQVKDRLATLRRHQPTGPLMCSEFWIGWFDSWGEHHHTTAVESAARDLAELLELGASVNIYMFHGGTNFGFTNGANDKGTYRPITTSYDYDALLDESGNETSKYWAFREVLAPYAGIDPIVERSEVAPAPTPSATLDRMATIWDVVDLLGSESWHDHAPTLDSLDAFTGFGLYSAPLPTPGGMLEFGEIRDRAQIFADRLPVGVLSRENHERRIALPAHTSQVELLVEDQGRVNYGGRIGEPKGVIGPVTLEDRPLRGWSVRPLSFERLDDIYARATTRSAAGIGGPSFVFASAEITDPHRDHYLDTSEWGKGVAWVNGFCLGRYWSRGPQRTLYVPAPVLRAGMNQVAIFELHAALPNVTFVAGPHLGPTEV